MGDTFHRLAVLAVVLPLLASCGMKSPEQVEAEQSVAKLVSNIERRKIEEHSWQINKLNQPASGRKICLIDSPYYDIEGRYFGVDKGLFIGAVKVLDTGHITWTVSGRYSDHPGSTLYLSIDGQRFTGIERFFGPGIIDQMIDAGELAYEYTEWPSRTEDGVVSSSGLRDRVSECKDFLAT